MSELSYLGKLLDGVEVEWKMLGEVIHSLKTGLNPRQNFSLNTLDAQGYYVTVREIQNGKVVFLDKTDRVNDRALKIINGRSNLEAGDILFSGTGTVGRIAVIEENPINWNIKEGVYTIKPIKEKIAPRFLSYLLQSSKIVKDYSKKIVGNPVISLPMGDLKKLLIPIPCPGNPEKSLAIQAEIVRILDKFTALTAELTAELSMRKKQYNYYRDQLLSFDEGEVEWKMLGDLGENLDSKRKPITSGLREAGSIPYYGASGIVDYVKDYIFDGDFLLISEDGANLLARNTPIAFSISGKSWVNNHAHVIKFDSYAERRYVEYYLNSIDLAPYISGAAQPKLNKKNLESIRIPNPSPEDKERIVSILDKFDALTNSINEGLPREIELRQKQYEYYRDLLFSFPRPETASN
ncbi:MULTISPECIES: restriction endonuclease subunit S [Enterobacteriaceae]|nr:MULTISPECIES: restriction endonuclease subunit S [Enterobacteriaceae]EDR0039778.1 restriction endonuclease subunit S [Salmonella enterica]EJK8587172.1 restriction endonuclease subunit S [Enterobacter hormaechei]EKT9840589.1 restriction endonuclease subunit S [Enterobacter hormaechei]EKV3713017.1 restriction endonuclease subunit S [Enterobacter hormaechei]EKV9563463.1 restriction endonuclease subunit S [Enterobacter hormaechei]